MEVTVNYSAQETVKEEIHKFVVDGLQDVYHERLLDFDTTFDELEQRYSANG